MTSEELKFNFSDLRYTAVIGTGGLGSGKFFQLNGDHTLGREESRNGHFLNRKDHCKQHIILHYVKKLMGRLFEIIPVGRIGEDETGSMVYNEMAASGFNMQYTEKTKELSTLFSFCFFYPDGSGGNLTTDNSASASVNKKYVERVIPEIERLGDKAMIVAAPEVPVEARATLLSLGKKYGAWCVASFTSEEMTTAMKGGLLQTVDLLAINLDEASAAAQLPTDISDVSTIVEAAVDRLNRCNSNMHISITAGREGSYCFDGKSTTHFPALPARVNNTAGAGDAFLAGLLCGAALGIFFQEAQQLAAVLAGFSVESPDTIHQTANRSSLNEFLQRFGFRVSSSVYKLLEE